MLTNETKRHIDAARQILVGVVPNPASQVDQITNALIYKFMDDMDQAAIKQGDEPSFFVGDLEKFAWTRLMDSRIGNQERMNLYSEALIKFSESKQLPELFRNIFRSAFLPYRSPEVLGLFLNEINHFDYSHPEELGNAYEYLLQVIGSQGDAGQFRTPRHIIDFIVNVVSPTKDEKVLDPACGTAGFLISAYKHILAQHDGKNEDGTPNKERSLTPDDRRNITNNFEGYDIDPSMVRIAQVNMYLHQFKSPKIFQYDTLSMEERWGDKFDVILANPPFMSPKGGIRPHSKFSIQSNRSEVLFVDYIKEHLKPSGRAGVIVPEGVIFQSGTAYKELRHQLVEGSFLWAVVSLPAGVFQPYSGVKTSILFFDRELARLSGSIVFMKISNDGYDLGAQRRKIDKDDLPTALMLLDSYKRNITAHNLPKTDAIEPLTEHTISVFVPKSKIRELGDYYLTGDRYKVINELKDQKWPMVELGDVLDYEQPTRYIVKSVDYNDKYKTPVLTAGKTFVLGYTNETEGIYGGELPVIIFDDFTTATKLVDFPFKVKSSAMKILHAKKSNVDIRFVYYAMRRIQFPSETHKRYWISEYSKIKIPLPPIEVQKQVVKELDGYQKVIDGAKRVVNNWNPKVNFDPEWEKVRLGEVSQRVTKGATPTTYGFEFQDAGINFVKIESIDETGNFINEKLTHINHACNEAFKRSQLKENDILFSIAGALGRVALVDSSILPANTNQALAIISPKEEVDPLYLKQVLRSDLIQNQIYGLKVGVAQSNLSLAQVSNFEIPLPSIEIQKQIVEEIELERKLVDGNKKLIAIYIEKIKTAIDRLWEQH